RKRVGIGCGIGIDRAAQAPVPAQRAEHVVVVLAEDADAGDDAEMHAMRIQYLQVVLGGEAIVRHQPGRIGQRHVLQEDVCVRVDDRRIVQHGAHPPDSGIGYSSALSTQPAIFEKSMRGGAKMSMSWLPSVSVAAEVWMAGGGITAMDGAGQCSWSSSRQWRWSAVHGQRMWCTKAPFSAREHCSKSSW